MTEMFLVAMAAPSQGGPSAWVQLMPFALVLGIFYFIGAIGGVWFVIDRVSSW